MTPFIISQILAFITLIIGMAAFQFKDRQNILRGWFFAAMFAAAHFYYLDNIEAAILVAIIGIRFLVSSMTFDKRLMYFFMAVSLAAYALTYTQPVSLLALTATMVGTWGTFQRSQTTVRLTMMSTELLWVVHNFIIWSPVAVGMEVLFFASNMLGFIRHRKAQETAL
ncbi:MAG: YgjV family protein [Gammaproteobacteria bacterium]|nr:YgjV family protein [Gammaproteobacteria bacterium]